MRFFPTRKGIMLDTANDSASTVVRPALPDWRVRYARRLFLTDVVAVAWAVTGAQLVWFGSDAARVEGGRVQSLAIDYATVSVFLVIAWALALQVSGSRDARVIGSDMTEYRRVVVASFGLFGVVAMAAYLLNVDLARGYLVTALPLGLLVLLTTRWTWRRWLKVRRQVGEYSYRLVLVGSAPGAMHLAEQFKRATASGYHVVAAVIPGASFDRMPGIGVPVWNDLDEVLQAMDSTGADTVAITSSDDLPPDRVRELSWSLEAGRRHLIMAPSLTDIAGPRIHTRPVAGLPLIHVETPRYEGGKLYLKRGFDVTMSSLLILALAPGLLAVMLAIKITSPGPIFFSQPRVGKNGDQFRMLKFRSMVVDAEGQLSALQDRQRTEGNSILFKMKDDPRVTRIGKILRRYSIDELPQLFNVLVGDMSLVGPRPPLFNEVEQYEWRVHRRFLVKPGITGLWQVSGRSDLSWEDTVRLDLYYVENWSLTGDLTILWKTARAVVASRGAY